jgi:hypothetical protein
MSNEINEIRNDFLMLLLKWIGIVILISCAASLFISTPWLNDQIKSMNNSNYANDDSDAAMLLKKVEYWFIEAAIWMKNLPLIFKIGGIGFGLLMIVIGPSDDD